MKSKLIFTMVLFLFIFASAAVAKSRRISRLLARIRIQPRYERRRNGFPELYLHRQPDGWLKPLWLRRSSSDRPPFWRECLPAFPPRVVSLSLTPAKAKDAVAHTHSPYRCQTPLSPTVY